MGLFQSLKRVLGLAEEAQQIVVPIVDEVAELARELRQVDLVGALQTPKALCLLPGVYGLVREGQLVERPGGAIELCRMAEGGRFPPGMRKGDRWKRFSDVGVILRLLR